MKSLDPDVFAATYRQTVLEVTRHWTPAIQADIARHNVGWSNDTYDFSVYLELSLQRYLPVFRHLTQVSPTPRSVVDLGGFWGVLPVTLARLGLAVTMTESLGYYGEAFEELFGFVRHNDVSIIDYDPFTSLEPPPVCADAVTAMAIMEHYPHSLRQLMTNIRAIVGANGWLLGDVPNIAFLPRRIALLRGHSPLVPVDQVYRSDVPFTGHHHEFSSAEVTALAELSGFKLITTEFLNYSLIPGMKPFRESLRHPRSIPRRLLHDVAFSRFPKTREVIFFIMQCR